MLCSSKIDTYYDGLIHQNFDEVIKSPKNHAHYCHWYILGFSLEVQKQMALCSDEKVVPMMKFIVASTALLLENDGDNVRIPMINVSKL